MLKSGEKCACRILEELNVTQPTFSHFSRRIVQKRYSADFTVLEQTQYSKTFDKIPAPDIAISMGCDVGCPYIGGTFDDNWGLQDPTGQSDAVFIEVIRRIEQKICDL